MKYIIDKDGFCIELDYTRGLMKLRIIGFDENLRGTGNIWETNRINVMSYDSPEIRDEGGYLEIYLNGDDYVSDNRITSCHLLAEYKQLILKSLEKYRIDKSFKKLKVI